MSLHVHESKSNGLTLELPFARSRLFPAGRASTGHGQAPLTRQRPRCIRMRRQPRKKQAQPLLLPEVTEARALGNTSTVRLYSKVTRQKSRVASQFAQRTAPVPDGRASGHCNPGRRSKPAPLHDARTAAEHD